MSGFGRSPARGGGRGGRSPGGRGERSPGRGRGRFGGRGGRDGGRGGRDGGRGRGGRGGRDGGRGRGGRGGRDGGRGGRGGGMKSGAKVIVEPHRHAGVFVARGKEDALVTLNGTPGVAVYRTGGSDPSFSDEMSGSSAFLAFSVTAVIIACVSALLISKRPKPVLKEIHPLNGSVNKRKRLFQDAFSRRFGFSRSSVVPSSELPEIKKMNNDDLSTDCVQII